MAGADEQMSAFHTYDSQFGKMLPGTKYWDPMGWANRGILGGRDPLEKMLELAKEAEAIDENGIAKAVNVGAASAATGYAFTPLVWDRQIVDITRKFTPVIGLIPKVTNVGKTAEYYRITARGGATWGSETGALAESDDTGTATSANIKFLRVMGKVTGVAQDAGAHFLDAMQQQVVNKTQTMNEELEDTLINGNASTNTLRPDGLIVQLTSNNTDKAGAAPTLADLDTLVTDCFYAKGRPNMLITDGYTANKLKQEMLQYVRNVDPVKMFSFGVQAIAYNTIVGELPILVSQFMPTTSGSRRVLCVSTDFIEYRVLRDVTFDRLAKTEDAEKFYLRTYRTLVNKFPEGMGQLINCA